MDVQPTPATYTSDGPKQKGPGGKAKLAGRSLTAPIIKAMQPGDELADPDHPGLPVRCPKNGRPVFFHRYKTRAGALRQTEVGAFGDKPFATIRADWQRLRDAVRNGKDPQQSAQDEREQAVEKRRTDKAAAYSVADAIDHYLAEMIEPSRKAKGAAEVRRMLEKVKAKIGKAPAPAATVTAEQAHAVVLGMAKTPRLAVMTRAELRSCWTHGAAVGRLPPLNPFVGRTVGGKLPAKKRERVISKEEVGTLLRWMAEPGTYSRTVRDALELVLRTGLRSGEVCAMHKGELQHRGGVLWLDIPGARMKAGKAHSVPLGGLAADLVTSRMAATAGYLFPSRVGDRPIEQKVLGVEVYAHSGHGSTKTYAAHRVCQVPEWASHDLRRTARTLLAELGCPFEVGEALLAHALPGVAAVYNRAAYDEAKVEWLRRLGAHLDEVTAGRPVLALVEAAA